MLPADPAARAGSTPEASGDTSSGTLGNNMRIFRIAAYSFSSVCLAVILLACLPVISRTPAGKVARFLMGSPLAQQAVEDLSADARAFDRDQVAKWVDDIIQKYESGEISSDTAASDWHVGNVHVPDKYIPEWFPSSWRKPSFGIDPELAIFLNEAGEPQFVVFGWYLKGVVFSGYREAEIDFNSWRTHPLWMLRQVHFSIYPYSLEK